MGQKVGRFAQTAGHTLNNAWGKVKKVAHRVKPYASFAVNEGIKMAPLYANECPECAGILAGAKTALDATDTWRHVRHKATEAIGAKHPNVTAHIKGLISAGTSAYESGHPAVAHVREMARSVLGGTAGIQQTRHIIEQSSSRGTVPRHTDQTTAYGSRHHNPESGLIGGDPRTWTPQHNPLSQDIGLFGPKY